MKLSIVIPAHNEAGSIGSTLAGSMMQQVLAAPLFVGGALKIVYDLVLYRAFRDIHPPEESRAVVVAPCEGP